MTGRRTFATSVVGALVLPPVAQAQPGGLLALRRAGAQPVRRVYRIGWLDAAPANLTEWRGLFIRALGEPGWRERRDHVSEWRQPSGPASAELEPRRDLAVELTRRNLDVLVDET